MIMKIFGFCILSALCFTGAFSWAERAILYPPYWGLALLCVLGGFSWLYGALDVD